MMCASGGTLDRPDDDVRTVMRRSLACAGAVLLLGLSACSGNSTETYCDDLEQAKEDFDAIEGGDLGQFDEALEQMQELGDNAPDEVTEDWDRLNGAIDEIRTGVEDLGIEFEDLGDPEALQDVDQEQLAEFGEKMQAMGSGEVQDSADAIAEHAEDECGVELQETPAPESE